MRRLVILLALMVAAVALVLRWCSAPDDMPSEPRAGLAPETAPRVGGPDSADGNGAETRARETSPQQEPPRLPPSGDTPRVTFDRGPMRPGENPDRYDDRVWFTERFDAFVRASGITEEQRRALLVALYDDVSAMRPLWEPAARDLERGSKPTEEWAREMFGSTTYDWVTSLARILTPDQIRVWYRHCAGCSRRLSQMIDYDEPVLRLE